MIEPEREVDRVVPSSPKSAPTVFKALLRERNLHSYTMFKRAYEKAARRVDSSLASSFPASSTFKRWVAGRIKEAPYGQHRAVLEAMFPGWTAPELFEPYMGTDDESDPILLKVLLKRQFLYTHRAFREEYDNAARRVNGSLVGSYPAERTFFRWISGDMAGLPYSDHCSVLEAMFPGYTARQLFEPPHGAGFELADCLEFETTDADAAPPETGSARQNSSSIIELCDVLTDYGFDPSRFSSVQCGEVPLLADLERDLRVTFDAYQQSRFTSAASRASTLVADAQLAAREYQGAERTKSFGLLALSYQAAASVLTKVGESDLALVAAERGLNAAKVADSPVVQGSLIRSVAFALLSTDRLEPAMRLIESGADYIRADVVGDDAGLSVYGMLFLAGAMASARFGDSGRTADYLQEANDAAQLLGKDANHFWTAFGPTNVAIHRVNTAVELGDMQTALDSGPSLNTDAVPAERRVRYLLDVARAYSLTGSPGDALGTLLTAERMAPEQVRQHHLASKVVLTLIKNSAGKPSVELDKLARRVNVHGSI